MRPALLLLALLTTCSAARAATPGALGGFWQLTNVQGPGRGPVSPGTAYLMISGGTVQGRFGCGAFAGSAEAADHRIRLDVQPVTSAPAGPCPLTPPEAFLVTLNSSEQYVVSEAKGQLVLFSKTARLTFERPGAGVSGNLR